MTVEECVLLALALDNEESKYRNSFDLPLLRFDLCEIGVEVRSTLHGDLVRILLVTNEL